MLPRSQFRKYSPQETLSTLTFKKHSFKVRCWLFHQIAIEKASACFLVRHSRDISYTTGGANGSRNSGGVDKRISLGHRLGL